MNLELINTGSELLLGRTLNTHQQWIGRQLADHGYALARQTTVADTGPAIEEAVREALSRADGVITTGGLGPTSDDLTREHLARLLELPLVDHPETLARLRQFCATRRRPWLPRIAIQARIPAGALVLTNQLGTAPGLFLHIPAGRFRVKPGWLAMLPGPPRELHPMFVEGLLPLILRHSPLPAPFIAQTLRCTGVGESQVEARIAPPLQPLLTDGLEIAYCARPGQVDVRLSARGPDAARTVEQAARVALGQIGEHVFGEGDVELPEVVVTQLRAARKTLAIAESCTGGHVADLITDVPGASEVLLAGWVTYSNTAKERDLGVPAEVLAHHGAVSEPVCQAMAEGARRTAGTDYALALTGIAGPSGGTPTKPIGTVFIALAGPTGTSVIQAHNPWERITFKQVAAQQALELLRRSLRGQTGEPTTQP